MRKNPAIITQIICLTLCSILQFHQAPTLAQTVNSDILKPYPPAQLKEDYHVLIKTLQHAYPSLYRYNSQKHIEQFFRQKLNSLNRSMTEKEFFPIIASTAAELKDEHVIPSPSRTYYEEVYKKQTRFLPFNIRIINEKVFVLKSYIAELTPGIEIISINGIPANSILSNLSRLIHRDGYIKTFLYRHLEDYSPTQNENLFDLYFSFLYDLPIKFPVKCSTQDGTLSEVSINSLTYQEYSAFYFKRKLHNLPLEYKPINNQIFYIGINSFHFFYREMHKQDFDKLFEEIFSDLDNNKTKDLILDLRHCEGGDNSYLLLMSYLIKKPIRVIDYLEVAYGGYPSTSKYFENPETSFLVDSMLYRTQFGMYRLKKGFETSVPGYSEIFPKAASFKGNLYVLTSGATGSAAGILCSILRNSQQAMFIGEETGSAMDGPTSLNISALILPNTKIRVEIPHIRVQLAVDHHPTGRGVIPDHAIVPDPTDLINNVDTQFEFVLNLITNNSHKVPMKN